MSITISDPGVFGGGDEYNSNNQPATNANGQPNRPLDQTVQAFDADLHATLDHLLTANEIASTQLFNRFGRKGRTTIDEDCGYIDSSTIDIDHLYELYKRDPLARRICSLWPEESWRKFPTITDTEEGGESDFQTAFEQLCRGLNGGGWSDKETATNEFWNTAASADELAQIGNYACIVLGIDDGKSLSDPVDGFEDYGDETYEEYFSANEKTRRAALRKRQRKGKLTGNRATPPNVQETKGVKRRINYMQPYSQRHCRVIRWETRPNHKRYGQPVMYELRTDTETSIDHTLRQVDETRRVHWSRVVHVCPNAGESRVMADSQLLVTFNRLWDAVKVYAGGGEGFWQGALPGISLEPAAGKDVRMTEDDVTEAKKALNDYVSGVKRFLMNNLLTAKTLSPQVVSPRDHIEVIIEAICIVLGVPVRIFKGSERGELASSQDESAHDGRCESRREKKLGPRIVVPLIDRLIALEALPQPKQGGWTCRWPSLREKTPLDRAELVAKYVEALSKYIGGGVTEIISPEDLLGRKEFLGLPEDLVKEVLERAAEVAADAEEEQQKQQQQQAAKQPLTLPAPPGSDPVPAQGGDQTKPGQTTPPTGKQPNSGPQGATQRSTAKGAQPKQATANAAAYSWQPTANAGSGCGIGPGGFQPGNTCAKGRGKGGNWSGPGEPVSLEGSTLYRASNSKSKDLSDARGGHSAIGAGTYLAESKKDVQGYGSYVHEYTVGSGMFLKVAGDRELDPVRKSAAEFATKKMQTHLDSVAKGKATIDPEFIAKTANPPEQIRMYLSSKGFKGIQYKNTSKDDHHDQVLIFDSQSVTANRLHTVNAGGNCGIGSGGFQPGNTCAKGGGRVVKVKKVTDVKAGDTVVIPGYGKGKVLSTGVPDMDGDMSIKIKLAKKPDFLSSDETTAYILKHQVEGGLVNKLVRTTGFESKLPTSDDAANQLTEVQSLGGSTGAKLVQDKSGNRFVKKYGANEGHIVNEWQADMMYKEAGVAVPDSRLYKDPSGKTYKLAEFKEGKTLGTLSGKEKQDAIKKVQEDFAIDATLGNWDVVGLDQDNILVDNDGTPWRIDNGGALRYRAQGGLKGDAWNTNNSEVGSMRNDPMNPGAKSVFGTMSDAQVKASFDKHAATLAVGQSGPPKFDGAKLSTTDKLTIKARANNGYNAVKNATSTATGSGAAATVGTDHVVSLVSKGNKNVTKTHIEKVKLLNPNGVHNGEFVVPIMSGPLGSAKNQELINHYKDHLPPGTKITALAASTKNIKAGKVPKGSKVGTGTGTKFKGSTGGGTAKAAGFGGSTPTPKPKATQGPTKPADADKHPLSKTVKVGTLKPNGVEVGSHIELSDDGWPPLTETELQGMRKQLEAKMGPAEHSALDSWKTSAGGFRYRISQGTGSLTEQDLAIRNVLNAAPGIDGVTFRGLHSVNSSNPNDYTMQQIEKIKSAGVGGLWSEPCPACSSRNASTGHEFALKYGTKGSILLKIRTRDAGYVGRTQGFHNEDEAMLRPGKIYRMTRMVEDAQITTKRKGTKTVSLYVEMEEVG